MTEEKKEEVRKGRFRYIKVVDIDGSEKYVLTPE